MSSLVGDEIREDLGVGNNEGKAGWVMNTLGGGDRTGSMMYM